MANCRSNCGCGGRSTTRSCGCSGSARRGYGVLRSVPNFGCCYRNDPFYTGPCPPAPCEYSTGCCDYDDCDDVSMGGYAMFTASGAVSVAAGGAVALTPEVIDEQSFALRGSSIYILQPGVYQASYTLNVPAGTPVNTVMELALDNRAVPASEVDVTTNADDSAGSFYGQSIFAAQADEILNLDSISQLTINGPAGSPVFTLMLIRIA